jgi:two-component system response regulator HydG
VPVTADIRVSLPLRADSSSLSLADFGSDDAPMRDCLALARTAAGTDLPILILGESGTGKTILARAIHNSSARAQRAFASFNAAALSETLLDSQLFGHERGAFTGAERTVKGKFEQADRGTLFIDEIADMSPTAQAKILRAVEYGEFERLGSERLQIADVRLISATHLPLARFIASEQFRKDLFYRISGITLRLPPLRARPNDLRALVAAEIRAAGLQQHKTIVGLSRAAMERLFAYAWPGNLRELKRVIHSAVALTESEIIQPAALLLEESDGGEVGDAAAEAATSARVALTTRAGLPRANGHVNGGLALRDVELHHINHVLDLMSGNKRRAAQALGLSRSTLDRKLSANAPALSRSDTLVSRRDATTCIEIEPRSPAAD